MADNTTLNTGSGGDVVASDDISSVKYQRIKLIYGVDGTNDGDVAKTNPLPTAKSFATRSDTFTAAGNGTQVDVSARPCSQFALQVKGTGATPTAWNVVLEGSLNGTNYTTIVEHSNAGTFGATSDGGVVQTVAAPYLYFRARCVSITLGSATNMIATIVGMQ